MDNEMIDEELYLAALRYLEEHSSEGAFNDYFTREELYKWALLSSCRSDLLCSIMDPETEGNLPAEEFFAIAEKRALDIPQAVYFEKYLDETTKRDIVLDKAKKHGFSFDLYFDARSSKAPDEWQHSDYDGERAYWSPQAEDEPDYPEPNDYNDYIEK